MLHFKTFHLKTKNKTKNWFCLGTNITNDARNDWTLHLHPQRASMFSNERKFSFLDLSYPKPNLNEKFLKIPNIYTKIHHLSIVPKKFILLLTLLCTLVHCISFWFHPEIEEAAAGQMWRNKLGDLWPSVKWITPC